MKAIILAAGKGKRMHSNTHKVLHKILGKPMLLYITEACRDAGIEDIVVVVGQDSAPVREVLPDYVTIALQETPQGTGHAVKAAKETIRPDEDVLVLCGDTPLITAAFLRKLTDYQRRHKADAVVTSVVMPDPKGYGRVYSDDNNVFLKIVEQADFSGESDADTHEINTGVYVFKGRALLFGLDNLKNNNKQEEYYLTDVPTILRGAEKNVIVYRAKEEPSVFTGINTQVQLAEAARFMRKRINLRHMESGVRIMDADTAFIDDEVVIAPEAVLYPGVILEGRSRVGKGAFIGPNTRLTDSVVGEGSTVQYSVLVNASVGCNTEVGPFAYLRPGAYVGDNCRIGDFVEVKNAVIGNNSKASHLSYIGDADVGESVNFSCGAVTVNYDGACKHRTTIKDHAFVGCNSNLVAPVTVGEKAFVAAGSTITGDIPDRALAIARQRQTNKENWKGRHSKHMF